MKVIPFTRPKFVTLYQTKNAQFFLFQYFVSDPVKQDPILDQFSMIIRPYTRPNGLKTIPIPAAQTGKPIYGSTPPPLGIYRYSSKDFLLLLVLVIIKCTCTLVHVRMPDKIVPSYTDTYQGCLKINA